MKNLLLIIICSFILGMSAGLNAQTRPIVTHYEVFKDLKWEADSNFHEVASDDILTERIITISPDWSSVMLQFIIGDDTLSYTAEIIDMNDTEINGMQTTTMLLLATDQTPFYIERTSEVTALYFSYDSDGGYGGFHKAELLTKLN